MVTSILHLLLLTICSLQFISLPAEKMISGDSADQNSYFLEEAEEVEDAKELNSFVGLALSLDCEHDEIVGEVHLLIKAPVVPAFLASAHSRGPPA